MYEALADVLGRDIRYGVIPTEPGPREAVKNLQELSVKTISKVEEMKNQELTTDAELASMMIAFEALPARQKKKKLKERIMVMAADAKRKGQLRKLETDLQAILAKNKATFDRMRRNERS